MNTHAVLLAAILAASSGVAQVPLSIDTTFHLETDSRNAFSLAFMPDDYLLVSGHFDFPDEFPNGIYQRSMLRLADNGEIDLDFPCCPSGGKIVPLGDRFYSGNDPGVRRFFWDGQLDPSFDMVGDPLSSAVNGGDYHVYSDGRVLLTGLHQLDAPQHGFDGVYNLVWLTNAGRLDTTRVHRSGNGINWAIKEIPAGTAGGLGGKFLLHTWGTEYDGHQVDKVLRIHADGSVDTTFNSNIDWGVVWALEPLPDGRAYIGGMFRMEGSTDTLQVVRVMPDGSLDPTFNNALDM